MATAMGWPSSTNWAAVKEVGDGNVSSSTPSRSTFAAARSSSLTLAAFGASASSATTVLPGKSAAFSGSAAERMIWAARSSFGHSLRRIPCGAGLLNLAQRGGGRGPAVGPAQLAARGEIIRPQRDALPCWCVEVHGRETATAGRRAMKIGHDIFSGGHAVGAAVPGAGKGRQGKKCGDEKGPSFWGLLGERLRQARAVLAFRHDLAVAVRDHDRFAASAIQPDWGFWQTAATKKKRRKPPTLANGDCAKPAPWLAAHADDLRFETPLTAQRLMLLARKYVAGDAFDEKVALKISRQLWGHDGQGARGQGIFDTADRGAYGVKSFNDCA